MRFRRSVSVVALAVALGMTVGCVDTGSATAYCEPDDLTVASQTVAPGGELSFGVTGPEETTSCEPRLPDHAVYELRIRSEQRVEDAGDGRRYAATLGGVGTTSGGAVSGVMRLPADVPAGAAEVTVHLVGVDTVCDLDPTIGCAPPPFAAIVVAG